MFHARLDRALRGSPRRNVRRFIRYEPERLRGDVPLPMPPRTREWVKGTSHDSLLRSVEHEGIVHATDPALDIVKCVTGIGAPRSLRHQERQRIPNVDPDRAIAQVGDGLLKL